MTPDISSLRNHINLLCADGRRPRSIGYKNTQAYICDFIASCGHTVKTQEFFALPFGRCKNIYTEVGNPNNTMSRTVVGAHYDTLGRSGPGADDNASAVAIVLELISKANADVPMTFVLFDYEESFGFGATKGSRAFVSQYDKPIKRALVLDLVGGSLMPGFDNVYFQFGPSLPPLQSTVVDFFHLPMLFVEPVGTCVPRSDYGRFRSVGIPFTFISSGTPWYYHTINDVPENLRYPKMAALMTALSECLSKQLQVHSPLQYEPSWSQFQELARIISSVPAFDDPFFHRLAQLENGPSRSTMLRMYFKVLPALKKLGPDLWV